MNIQTFSDKEAYLQASVEAILKVCNEKQEMTSIALPGGSIRSVYEILGNKIGSCHVEFFQVDERYVSPDHEESNQNMIRETLISPSQKPFCAFDTSLSIQDCLDDYQEKLEQREHDFDLCLLGVGPDGHIGALYPEIDALLLKGKLVEHTKTDRFAIKQRVTLTYTPILRSKKIFIFLSGHSKQAVVDELQKSDNGKDFYEFPINKLKQHSDVRVFFCSR